jgi:membrane dipeptidase
MADKETGYRGRALHAGSIVIDGLNISLWDRRTFLHLRGGGVTAINATLCTGEGFRTTIGFIAEWQRRFEQHRDLIMPVRTVADICAAKKAARVGVIMGFQNSSPIEDDLYLLSIFKELGVRIIQLTYNDRNFVGDGCLERTDGGLSNFGIEVVREMNRLGMLIDLSHAGHRTTMEAIEVSQKPVAFTHAGPRALFDHPRNKTDEELRYLANKGGVAGANAFPEFLAAGWQATLSDFLDTVDYMVERIGVDHVSLGLDLTEGRGKEDYRRWEAGKIKQRLPLGVEWPVVYPEGIRSAVDWPNITDGLLARGYSEPAVQQILGGNLLRLFEEVWG